MFWLTIGRILIIAAIAFAMLLFPVTISAISNKEGKRIEGNFCISWLIFRIRHSLKDKRTDFFLLWYKVGTQKHREEQTKESEETEQTNKIKEMKRSLKKEKTRKIPPIEVIVNFIGPLFGLIHRLVTIPRFKYLDIDCTYGLDDPAICGILTGLLHSNKGASQIGNNVRFTPDFTGTLLNWDLKILTSITLIRIFLPLAKFISNINVLKFGWVMIRS
ncbi:MAG: DUF2953 domain-containing protein [Methanosarcinales archaeon]|nr:DUF2953 domain-containing protein [Methanosarcinales archaeon]